MNIEVTQAEFLRKGSFNNYVDKKRWVGGRSKMSIFVHNQSEKCSNRGRYIVGGQKRSNRMTQGDFFSLLAFPGKKYIRSALSTL